MKLGISRRYPTAEHAIENYIAHAINVCFSSQYSPDERSSILGDSCVSESGLGRHSFGGSPTVVRQFPEAQSKRSRTTPEQVSKRSRTSVEGYPNKPRTGTEEIASKYQARSRGEANNKYRNGKEITENKQTKTRAEAESCVETSRAEARDLIEIGKGEAREVACSDKLLTNFAPTSNFLRVGFELASNFLRVKQDENSKPTRIKLDKKPKYGRIRSEERGNKVGGRAGVIEDRLFSNSGQLRTVFVPASENIRPAKYPLITFQLPFLGQPMCTGCAGGVQRMGDVRSRLEASTNPVPRMYCLGTVSSRGRYRKGTGSVLRSYWRATKEVLRRYWKGTGICKFGVPSGREASGSSLEGASSKLKFYLGSALSQISSFKPLKFLSQVFTHTERDDSLNHLKYNLNLTQGVGEGVGNKAIGCLIGATRFSIVPILLLLLTFASLVSQAQSKQSYVLQGTVVSAVDKKPLQGVSLRVEAENIKISTKNDGTFSIPVAHRKGKVKFTNVGYKTEEQEYTSGVVLSVQLNASDNQLEEVEVVSTGFQKIPKERATGSFEFVDNKLFNRKVSTDFVSRLEDVVPGITSRKVSNNRGDLLNVHVRGISTLGSEGWPLVVVDGVPYDNKGADVGIGAFNNINPNDIESVTVLKDAAASSIWGAQSGNGVIVVTTKRGKFNERTQLSFNSNISIKAKPDLYYYPQMNTSDYIGAQQYLFDQGKYNSWFTDRFYNPQPALWHMYNRKNGNLSESDFNKEISEMKNTDMRDDFLKYIYRNAVNQQYHAQLQSGGEKVNTLFSAGYDKNLNDVVTSSLRRLNLKSNTQFKPLKNMVLDLGVLYTEIKNQKSFLPSGYNGLAKGMQNYPYMRLADEHGNPIEVNVGGFNPIFKDTVAGGRLLDWSYFPLNELNDTKETQQINEFLTTINAGYHFDFGLKLNLLYAYQRSNTEIELWSGIGSFLQRDLVNSYASWTNTKVTWNMPVGDSFYLANWDNRTHQGRATAEYYKKWNDKHELSLFSGMEMRSIEKIMTSSQYYGFNPETGSYKSVPYGIAVPMLNGIMGSSAIRDPNSFQHFQNNFRSYFANVGYTYLDRYIWSGSYRKDASNLFGVKSNDRGQPFWSLGGAWIVSKESFMRYSPFDYLKLRSTYGYNGNVNNRTSAYPIISIATNPNSTTGQNYGMITAPPNPSLRWERVAITNLGLDFALKGNRISGSVEYYIKNAKDLIAADRVDPSTGFTTLMINSGNIRTKGWDASLNIVPIQSKNWTWNSHLVFTYGRTKVLKSYVQNENGKDFIGSAQSNPRTPIEGMELYSLLAYKWAGLDPETGAARAYMNGELSTNYNAILALKVHDLENYGSTVPVYSGSWRNSVRYKALELSWNISYQLGHKFLRNSFDNNLFLNSDIGHKDYALRWQNPGDELKTDVPAFKFPSDLGSQIFMKSSALLENGGQIKLRDMQLSLNLPFANKFKLKNCRVYAYIQNVGIIWRGNKLGIDTEYGSNIPDAMQSSLGLSFNL
ncbi:SusC/RagA family TonB-linked outer membrane protein [Sphingobacterium faecium]|uniref:SusC/RagA family TonB-linked outer membrane protein n=1 Tax=Sphingobacterium faecium TaxID=34087 RepID=UPI0024693048|nr:SusC/RagA family TonB-linked outer membrane protein [Sphingobacterium faecium]MDH5827775.1 SusC/RagA family TonB-linked outer membrane protein [Sphingobacterium faecium]